MVELYPKFIIEDNKLILSKVTFHKELVNDRTKVKGGGWFSYKENVFTLFGDSNDFGKADIKNIMECIKSDNVYSNKNLIYSIAKKFKFRYRNVDTNKIVELN